MLLVVWEGMKFLYEAETIDASDFGLRVRVSVSLTPGQAVEIIPFEGPGYAVLARVVWAGSEESGHEGEAGLEFQKLYQHQSEKQGTTDGHVSAL
jgi:hypothetical protein